MYYVWKWTGWGAKEGEKQYVWIILFCCTHWNWKCMLYLTGFPLSPFTQLDLHYIISFHMPLSVKCLCEFCAENSHSQHISDSIAESHETMKAFCFKIFFSKMCWCVRELNLVLTLSRVSLDCLYVCLYLEFSAEYRKFSLFCKWSDGDLLDSFIFQMYNDRMVHFYCRNYRQNAITLE